jgi:hypothetical protein
MNIFKKFYYRLFVYPKQIKKLRKNKLSRYFTINNLLIWIDYQSFFILCIDNDLFSVYYDGFEFWGQYLILGNLIYDYDLCEIVLSEIINQLERENLNK